MPMKRYKSEQMSKISPLSSAKNPYLSMLTPKKSVSGAWLRSPGALHLVGAPKLFLLMFATRSRSQSNRASAERSHTGYNHAC